MKKTLKYQFIGSVIIYLAIYLFRVFVDWNFMNPFDWIIEMPNYSSYARALILISLIFYVSISCAIWYGIIKEWEENKK